MWWLIIPLQHRCQRGLSHDLHFLPPSPSLEGTSSEDATEDCRAMGLPLPLLLAPAS